MEYEIDAFNIFQHFMQDNTKSVINLLNFTDNDK